jgi:hypothetical protein
MMYELSDKLRKKALAYRSERRQQNFKQLIPSKSTSIHGLRMSKNVSFPQLAVEMKRTKCQIDVDKIILRPCVLGLMPSDDATSTRMCIARKISELCCNLRKSFKKIIHKCDDESMLLEYLEEEIERVFILIRNFHFRALESEGYEHCEWLFEYVIDEFNQVLERTVAVRNTKRCPKENGRFFLQFGIDVLYISIDDISTLCSW